MTADLRPAVADDHDAIVALPGLSGSTRRLLAADLQGELPRHVVVAVVDGQVVAVGITTRQPDQVHLLDLVVHPRRRRRGLARLVLGELARRASVDGATAMTLEVRASNEAGRGLYRACGFVDHGTRPGYYRDGEDAQILWHHDLALLAGAVTVRPGQVDGPEHRPDGRSVAVTGSR